ncbi:hypothetical protein [Amycolatopsis sp. NPDC051903]
MPILAVGGEDSSGEVIADQRRDYAVHVEGVFCGIRDISRRRRSRAK